MGTFYFERGLVISRYNQILEYVSRYNHEIYFEDPGTGQQITILEPHFWGDLHAKRIKIVNAFSSPKELNFVADPTDGDIKTLADLDEKNQLRADIKLQYIKRLKERNFTKGQLGKIKDAVQEIATEISDELSEELKKHGFKTPLTPPSPPTVNNWWNRLEKKNGDVYILVAGHAHRNRDKNLDDDSELFLQNFIDDHYAIKTRPSAASVHRDYLDAVKKENVRRAELSMKPLIAVSERTLYRRIDERSKAEMMACRMGREAARHHHRMIRGHLPAVHPLDAAEIDHTPMNLYVIDDGAFIPLGRPWLTAIKDRHTGVLLGFYVTFRQTGLDSIFGALKHSLDSHHLAYEIWDDLENPWPFGRAYYYFSDRGGDFISQRYRTGVTSLGAFYEYAKRRTPWLKASIERFFRTLEQTFFESMPGRTFANLVERGDYKPEKDAVIRFSTLIYLLHKWAADYHNVSAHSRKLARPIDLWNDGIKTAPPPYLASVDELNIVLGDRRSGKLSQEGIRFGCLNYADDQLRELMDYVGVGFKANYVVSNENLGEIAVHDPRTRTPLFVPCTRPDYAWGLSQFQHKLIQKEAKIQLESRSDVDALCRTRARIKEMIGEEMEAKKTANKSKLARLAGINSNAVLEGRQQSILAPFSGQPLHAPDNRIIVPSGPSFTNVPTYSWGV